MAASLSRMSPARTTPAAVAGTGITPADRVPAGLRRARLDQPLGQQSLDPTYADAHLERLVQSAADDASEAARAQGYARGWAEGQRAAAEVAKTEREQRSRDDAARLVVDRARLNTALTALAVAAEAVATAESESWEALADGLTDGVVRIVEAVLARELAAADATVVEAVRTSLRALGSTSPTVALHPDDVATIRAAEPDAAVVADRRVAPGSAVARLGDAQVLVDLPATLARIESVLHG